MSDLVSQSVLIDLDTLLDTRIGTIKNHFPETASKIVVKDYVNRIRNDLWNTIGVTEEQWTNAWKNRDVLTLANSTFTGLYHNTPLILGSILANGKVSPVHDELRITVNVWPYKLNEQELEDIVYSVQARLWDKCDITTCYLPPDAITPDLLNTKFKTYITYDFEYWMSKQLDAFKIKRVPTVTVYYPAIVNHYNEEEFKIMMDKKVNPFDDLKRRLAEYLTCDAVDAPIFSCHYHQ